MVGGCRSIVKSPVRTAAAFILLFVMPADPVDLPIPSSLQRRLSSMGHGLHQFNEAWKVLAVRLDRGLLDEASTAWVKHWCGAALGQDLPLPIVADATVKVVWSGKTWKVDRLPGDAAWISALMLLHLPALRSFWRRALRSQRFAWMTLALPKVWAVDTQPLKPGTVIAGLGLTRWEDLPTVIQKGRMFSVYQPASGTFTPVDAASWPASLASAATDQVLLGEDFGLPVEGELSLSWQRDEAGRIVARTA